MECDLVGVECVCIATSASSFRLGKIDSTWHATEDGNLLYMSVEGLEVGREEEVNITHKYMVRAIHLLLTFVGRA